jgi:hypothetical protein
MLNISIDAENQPMPINVNDELATLDDFREAWKALMNGTLEQHLREAIRVGCAKRGVHPKILEDSTSN